jgi:predicted acyl esterase
MQDTRGRFASAGEEYSLLIWEMPDGCDAVEWAVRLSYADGHVGPTGQVFHDQRCPSHILLPIIPR